MGKRTFSFAHLTEFPGGKKKTKTKQNKGFKIHD